MTSPSFAMALLLAVSTPVAGLIMTEPQPGAPVLVIVMPWQDPGRIIQAAGGRQIGPETAVFAALGQSDDPGFARRLASAGSWFVGDGTRLAQFCGAF